MVGSFHAAKFDCALVFPELVRAETDDARLRSVVQSFPGEDLGNNGRAALHRSVGAVPRLGLLGLFYGQHDDYRGIGLLELPLNPVVHTGGARGLLLVHHSSLRRPVRNRPVPLLQHDVWDRNLSVSPAGHSGQKAPDPLENQPYHEALDEGGSS